jgi:predicted DCC family thiol-disulfide oxidoreductase YuxK
MSRAHDELIEVTDWDRQTERRALLIYDGACGFCRRCATYAQTLVGEDRLAAAAGGVVGHRFDELSDEDLEASVWSTDEHGTLRGGAAAVFSVLAMAPGYGLFWALYRWLPGFAALTEFGYRLVARHRHHASGAATLLFGQRLLPSSYQVSATVVVRLLGLVYVFAFGSLAVQLPGLVGEQGIMPLQDYLSRAQSHWGLWALWKVPTHGWLSASASSLTGAAWLGVLAGAGLIFGRYPRALAVLCWAVHLSLVTAGQSFLYYQWDSLLCEVGFLAIFLAPWGSKLKIQPLTGVQTLARWLILWLVWRLVFMSAYVKLASGDPAWATCSALEVHYQTQPLPNALAFYAHYLPAWLHQISCSGLLLIEFLAPCLLIGPRRLRHLGAFAIIILMSAIALTGNYGYFNLLTAALALLALDDRLWARRVSAVEFRPGQRGRWTPRILALILVLLSLSEVIERQRGATLALAPVRPVRQLLAPLRLTSSYGLFAVMTMDRPELILEGSLDGKTWRAYELPFKPGRLDRRPAQVAPHMPRLDWQLWFAALGQAERNTWLVGLLRGLMLDHQPVRALFAQSPFKGPPTQLRILRYRYNFGTDEGANWWRREPMGVYLKPVKLSRENKVIFAQPVDRVRPNP